MEDNMELFRRLRRADGAGLSGGGAAAKMVGFGPKLGWMAFLGCPQSEVAALLGLGDLQPASWQDAIRICGTEPTRVAVTPPLASAKGDWVLVVGSVLLQFPPNVVGWSEVAATEVQYFGTHRILEMQAWKRAIDGDLVRSFVWFGERGELREWVGRPDSVEVEHGLPSTGTVNEQAVVAILEAAVDEDTVLSVAAEWSINPTSLDGGAAVGMPLIGSCT